MHKVWTSYDNEKFAGPHFSGTYEQCIDWIRGRPEMQEPYAYDITYPSGRLASYIL